MSYRRCDAAEICRRINDHRACETDAVVISRADPAATLYTEQNSPSGDRRAAGHPDDIYYLKRKVDLDDRLYRMYDKIEDVETRLIKSREKKLETLILEYEGVYIMESSEQGFLRKEIY